MKRVALCVGVAMVAGLSGCASPRFIQKDATSGVIAIPENSNEWPTHYRDAAIALIKQHVGNNYAITDEHLVATNSRVTDPAHTLTPPEGATPASKEWRITYVKVAPGQQPGQPMGVPGSMTGARSQTMGTPLAPVAPASGLGAGGMGMMSAGGAGMSPGAVPPYAPGAATPVMPGGPAPYMPGGAAAGSSPYMPGGASAGGSPYMPGGAAAGGSPYMPGGASAGGSPYVPASPSSGGMGATNYSGMPGAASPSPGVVPGVAPAPTGYPYNTSGR